MIGIHRRAEPWESLCPVSALLSWSGWGRRVIPGRYCPPFGRGVFESAGPAPARSAVPEYPRDADVQPPDVTRTMVWLLLSRTPTHGTGHDATWHRALAEQWNREFTPVVPRGPGTGAGPGGQPLAHAARAAAGHGLAWWSDGRGTWRKVPAADALRRLGLDPAHQAGRAATVLADGLPGLAEALHHHVSLRALVLANTLGTRRLLALLGHGTERPHPVAEQGEHVLGAPYIMRRSWQLVLASVDHVTTEGARLTHAAIHDAQPPAGHAAQQLTCLHRSAFLAGRQQALLLDPRHNGGISLFAASGRSTARGRSDLPGTVREHLTVIRTHCHTVKSATGAAPERTAEVADALQRAWWCAAALFMTLTDLCRRTGAQPDASVWRGMAGLWTSSGGNEPSGDEVARAAGWLERELLAP